MIRLILGRAGSGKTARIFSEIAARCRTEQRGTILLVPEQYSHEAERELCRVAGDTLSLYGEVLSFTGLARRVFAQCGGAKPMMDGGGRLLSMASAMEAVADSLRLYQRGRRDVRLLESLVQSVEELKNAGLDAASLNDVSGGLTDILGDKLRDLALILEAYAAVQGRSTADPADMMEALAERIADSDAVRSSFFIDGFSDFTVLEKNVLRELIRAGTELTFCLTCSPDGESDVFSLPRGTVLWLRHTAEEYGIPCREEWLDRADADDSIRFFCDNLFDFSGDSAPDAGGTVRLVTAADPYEECELAAARMTELARGGVRWREMAVAVRGFGDYRTALESACARYEIPLFLSGRGDTLRKSVPLLIANALEAVERGYEYEAMFGYLKTGLTVLTPEETDVLENYVILWNIRGHMWSRPFTMHPDGYNHAMDEDAALRLDALNELRVRVMAPLKSLESAVHTASTAAGQAQALADFLVAIELPARLEARAAKLDAANRPEAAAEYEQLWSLVCDALEQFAAVLGSSPMDAARFRDLFSMMLSKYDVGIIPVSLDRVQAGDFDGMRRRHIRHLFVLGASDSRLPAPEEGTGVFTPEEREELASLGLPFGGSEESLSRELWRIYSCLSLPSDGLYISCPAMESDGSETRPSILFERARLLLRVEPEEGDLLLARTFSRKAAYTLALLGEAGNTNRYTLAAREVFRREGRGGELTALVDAVSAGRGNLGTAAVRSLYGENPALTATRAEKFADCRFSYFLQYGLKAKPRQHAVFDPRDYGTFIHYILENVSRDVMAEGGFPSATADRIHELTDQWLDRYIREEMNDFAEKTARFQYLFRRLRTTVRRVTVDMWQELRSSRFQPIDLELDLGRDGVLDPTEDDGGVKLFGRVDRVDGWVKDDTLYLRVTDYKTGIKKFSLSDVCEGVNLQMLLYLFTLEKRGKSYFGAKEIRPAGVLYSPARFDIIRADGDLSEEELDIQRRREARRSGLILSDDEVIEAMEPGDEKQFLPVKLLRSGGWSKDSLRSLATLEQFGALSRYIDGTLREMAAELRAGSVTADPWFRSTQSNACIYCDFAKACLFDETRDAWHIREELSPEKAWEKIGGTT